MLSELAPRRKQLVFDLVEMAGFDMTDWRESASNPRKIKANPKYCYEWAYVASEFIVLNLWHSEMKEDVRGITYKGNFRRDAQVHRTISKKPQWAMRAQRLDDAIATALRDGLAVRVIILAGKQRQKEIPESDPSRVTHRELDPEAWTITSYDAATGAFELMRSGGAATSGSAGLGEDPDWTWDEHVLALDVYAAHPVSVPGKTSQVILGLSALLNELGRREGVIRSEKFRNANGVYMKLMNFRRLDPAIAAKGNVGLTRGAKGEIEVWDRYVNDRPGLAAAAEAIRLAIADPTVGLSADGDQEEYEADESRVILKLHRSRERDGKLAAKKKASALAQHGVLRCEVCRFDFAERYGDHGSKYIEAHHIKPISTLKLGEKTKLDDLALVCANCHRMLHRRGGLIGIADLQAMLRAY